MIFCGWFDRRDFSMDLKDSLQSLLELLRPKFEFAFIKYSKFDVSRILCLGYPPIASTVEFEKSF